MTDAIGDEQVQVDQTQGQQSEQTGTDTTEGGATYGPQAILDQLDEFSQQKVRDQLLEMEKNATTRIESVNKSYEPWKQFETAGYTPDDANAAINMALEIQNNPTAFASRLLKHIQDEGIDWTPEGFQKAAADVAAGKDLAGAGSEGDDENSVIKELRAELDALKNLTVRGQQEQQAAQVQAQINTQVQNDIAAVTQAHPEYTKDDWQDIYRIADQQNRQLAEAGKDDIFTVQQAAEAFEGLRTRILTTSQRPGQTAPKLMPTGGSAPVEAEKRKLSEIGSHAFADEIGDILASQLKAD